MQLAEALLLRKELQAKVDRLKAIDNQSLFETKTGRSPCQDGMNDWQVNIPKMSFQQFTHCYDWHAKQLRLVDALIQKANWETKVDDSELKGDYVDPYVKD